MNSTGSGAGGGVRLCTVEPEAKAKPELVLPLVLVLVLVILSRNSNNLFKCMLQMPTFFGSSKTGRCFLAEAVSDTSRIGTEGVGDGSARRGSHCRICRPCFLCYFYSCCYPHCSTFPQRGEGRRVA